MPFMPGYTTNPLVSANKIADLLLEGFNIAFFEEFKRTDSKHTKFFKTMKSDKYSEAFFSTIGLGLAVEANEGGPTEFEDLAPGEVKEITISEYRKGYRISRRTIEDDRYKVSSKPFKSLPKCFKAKKESVCAGLVGGAFTTTLGWDPVTAAGVAICSTAHNYASGKFDLVTGSATTTWSNRLAIDSAPTPDTLQTMRILATNTRDREGNPIETNPDMLFASNSLTPSIWPIFHSTNKAFELSNTKSTWGAGGLWNMKVEDWKWMSSTTAWFMLDSDETPFTLLERIPVHVENDYDNNNHFYRYFGRERFGVGAIEPRGVWGTPGA